MTQWIYRADFSDSLGAYYRYASRAYTTTPAHPDLPNTFFEGRATQLVFRRDMYGQGRTYGDPDLAHGSLTLRNDDGGLDALVGKAFDGRRLRVWRIDPASPDDETLEQELVIEQISFSLSEAVIMVRDPLYLLDRALQATKYAGSNSLPAGVEGTADDIKGHPKPVALGVLENITPVLVNTSRLIYQACEAFNTGYSLVVYDKRATLTAGADYASQAAMEATAPAAGQYRVWPAGGMFRLGSAPAGQITCDLTNPGLSAGGGTSYRTVLEDLANLNPPSGLSYFACEAALINPADAAYGTVGAYFTEEVTVYQALRDVARCLNISFHVYPNRVPALLTSTSVMVQLARLMVPDVVSVLDLDSTNILAGSLQRGIQQDTERGIPPWRVNVRYRRNYTIQNAADLAGVAADQLAFTQLEYRTVQAEDATVLGDFPNAPELTVDTTLDIEANAQDHADYLLALMVPAAGTVRDLFTLRIPLSEWQAVTFIDGTDFEVAGLLLGQTVKVTYPRFGLDSGRYLVVLGYAMDYAGQWVELTLWG